MTGRPSVSFNLNVPGFPKTNAVAGEFFRICLQELKYFLAARRLLLDDERAVSLSGDTGDFFIAPVDDSRLSAEEIKQLCDAFEKTQSLGRFLDVDVTDGKGEHVSSGTAKPCFFCGRQEAEVCRHENAHEPEELRLFMFSKMEEYIRRHREEEICRTLSSLALKAVLYEISLSPKPGLVDRFSNGSHRDMNFRTFLDSTAAISGGFKDLVSEGIGFFPHDLENALPHIREHGLRMESAMYRSTQMVNAQKGLIFLMGVSLFACGYLHAGGDFFDSLSFRNAVKKICHDLAGKELADTGRKKRTHGEQVFMHYGVTGIRGEAEKGFPVVFDYGLPELLRSGSLDDATLQRALLSIAAHNDDTNILYRRGMQVLEQFKELAKRAYYRGDPGSYSRLAEFCAAENISPGGSADLLALSSFLYLVMQQYGTAT